MNHLVNQFIRKYFTSSYKNRGRGNRFLRMVFRFRKMKYMPLYKLSDFKSEAKYRITEDGRFQWSIPCSEKEIKNG